MERKHKPIDWSNFPPIEKCTSFGDTNNNALDISIDDIDSRVVKLNHDSECICVDGTVK